MRNFSRLVVLVVLILVAVAFVCTRWTNIIFSPAPSSPPQPQELSRHEAVSKTGKFARPVRVQGVNSLQL